MEKMEAEFSFMPGIITGADCYPANQRESDIILEHLKGQPCKYQNNAMKKGFVMRKKQITLYVDRENI